jgi:iron complex outermembrane recepter protein
MGGVAGTADRISTSVVRAALRGLPWALSAALAIAPRTAATQDASSSSGSSSAAKLPEIHVIATTPVAPPPRTAPARVSGGAAPAPAPGAPAPPAPAEAAPAKPVPGAVDQDKIPSNVQTVGAPDFSYTKTPDLLQSMVRSLPGVALSDETGNQFQLDLNYRGFIASPVIGTPQGLAVYQNGVRINEVFGDIVNWDFIPQNAISELTLYPSNPVFGLNAIGGALSFQMKNGFTYHGVEGEVSGGSYGRVGTSVQAGGEVGNLSGYFTADAIDDAGWRTDSPSTLRRMYADLGARGDQTEFHVTFTAADNTFGAAAATPVQMLNQDWSSIYTVPQTTHNQLAFLTASGTWKPSDTWTFQAVTYIRHYSQAHVDGNGTNADNNPADCASTPTPTAICFQNPGTAVPFSPLVTTAGTPVPNSGTLGFPNVLGEIDRTWTTTNSFGGSVQAASSEQVFGHDNNFTVGLSIDRGLVQFTTTSELGTVNADQFPVVYGSGLFIDQPSSAGIGGVAPVGLGAHTLYTGIYATDTLDLTKRLSLTFGARYNIANIALTDELGNDSELNGNDNYFHFNPMVGLTYKITPNLTLYGDYAVANRAPTPLELECSDPSRPCLIDNALVGDPPLKQVVTYTYEAGLRGQFDIATGHANWSVGAYHALNTNDIIDVLTNQTVSIGREFFQNASDTLRKGIEADFTYKQDRWNVYANYTYVDATFLNSLLLPSTVNTSGTQLVVPGDHLTGIPDYRFKLGAEYQITKPWLFGADLNIVGSQWLVGDESNQLPKVPAYWVVNLHSSYKISDNLEVFGLVRNLFNQHYYTFGTLTDVTEFGYLNLTDDRTFLPGMPFAAYLGLRGTLPSSAPVFATDTSRPVITKAAPVSWAPPTAVNWTGVYVGVNGGFTFGGSDWTDSVTGGSSDTFSTTGFVFGGTVGANYQAGSWVVGVEADGDLADSNGFGTFTTTSSTGLCAGGCITNNSWLATVRGRAGYAFDRFLVYGTGGAALGNIQAHFSNDPVTTSNVTGWTAGGGVEYALGWGWSAKAEYLFVDLGNGSCTTDCTIQTVGTTSALGPPIIPNVAIKFNESIVRAGINYKFGG